MGPPVEPTPAPTTPLRPFNVPLMAVSSTAPGRRRPLEVHSMATASTRAPSPAQEQLTFEALTQGPLRLNRSDPRFITMDDIYEAQYAAGQAHYQIAQMLMSQGQNAEEVGHIQTYLLWKEQNRI